MPSDSSRRDFVASSLTAAATLFAASPLSAAPLQALPRYPEDAPRLRIQPRYHRWHVATGVDWVETNTGHATLNWTIPIPQAAIVLVDVWNRHYLKDTEARTETVIAEKLTPLLTACRSAKLPIIHAPSPAMARKHPNWVRLAPDEAPTTTPDWPPSEFRNQTGAYKSYRRPSELRETELARLRAGLQLHPKIQPLADEPVIATGEELHRYCRREGILFLLFAGFNANACILERDYGVPAMRRRGYEVVIIRDCTTGMESRETQPTLSQTSGAILFLEMFVGYSVASDEIVAGLPGR